MDIEATWNDAQMLNKFAYRVALARQILKTEGLASLLKRLGGFIKWRSFVCETNYLYEGTTEDFQTLNEADFMPTIDNFTLRVVSSNNEADKLEAEGFEFRSQDIKSRYYLDNGAIALCIFIGTELVHVSWLEMTQQLTDTDILKVDYSNNEVHGGWGWTNPKYRGLGVNKYCLFKRRELVFNNGKTVIRASIPKSNTVSQASSASSKLNRKYAEVRNLRILGWKFIKITYVDGYKPPKTA